MPRLTTAVTSALLLISAPQPSAADELKTAGDVLKIAVPAYSLYASTKLNGRDGFWSCGGAIGATFLSTQALKHIIDSPRPNGGDHGFPSGHTSFAAVGFGCMLGQEGWSNTTIALGAASLLTGYSRVESDFHTWGQVGAGFALGAAIGYLGTRHLKKDKSIEYSVLPDGSHSLSFSMKY